MPLGTVELAAVLGQILAGSVPADLETDQLDFKQQPDSKPDAIRALVDASVCFANTSGGTVVMGMANRVTGPSAFAGCDLDPQIVQRRIHELTEPPLMVGTRAEEHAGTVLLVVDVFQSSAPVPFRRAGVRGGYALVPTSSTSRRCWAASAVRPPLASRSA